MTTTSNDHDEVIAESMESATALAVPTDGILTPDEQLQLHQCEIIIAEAAIAFHKLGEALTTIRVNRLYRASHATFEEYCEERWRIGKSHSNRLMSASRVIKAIETSPIGEVSAVLPQNEAQARPLTSLHEPEQIREAWGAVIEQHPDGQAPAREIALIVKAVRQANTASTEERKRPIFNQEKSDRIDWAMWSWNPVTGCKHGCPYCYAEVKATSKFYASGFRHGFTPWFYPERLSAPKNTKLRIEQKYEPGARNVFVCSMADLFGEWVDQGWIDQVLAAVRDAPEWNFIFLTKNPARLVGIEWPANAWVGTTVDTQQRVKAAEEAFAQITAPVKFVSVEPFLEQITFSSLEVFDWVIIGGSTGQPDWPEVQPQWTWVNKLIAQAQQANCKVYCKPNLHPIWPKEFPQQQPEETHELTSSITHTIDDCFSNAIQRQPDGTGIISSSQYVCTVGEPRIEKRSISYKRYLIEGDQRTYKKLPLSNISQGEIDRLFAKHVISYWFNALTLLYEIMHQAPPPIVGEDIRFNVIEYLLHDVTVIDQDSVPDELREMEEKLAELNEDSANDEENEDEEDDFSEDEDGDEDGEDDGYREERREEDREFARYEKRVAKLVGRSMAKLTMTTTACLSVKYEVILSKRAVSCYDAYCAAYCEKKTN